MLDSKERREDYWYAKRAYKVSLAGILVVVVAAILTKLTGSQYGLVPVWLQELAGYATDGFLLQGAWMAVKITALAMVFGCVLGLGLALMRLSSSKGINRIAWFYIWFVRGTPQLLQLVFIFNVLPLVGLKFDSFSAAVIGFALNEAAFAAELIRAGILSVNRNQSIAAASLGMGPVMTLRRIVMPQAMRAILPGLANDVIGMIKLTSIASVIFVNELTYSAQQIVGQNFKFFTVFGAAAAIYLAITSFISVVQGWLERKFDFELDQPKDSRNILRRLFGESESAAAGSSTGVKTQDDVSQGSIDAVERGALEHVELGALIREGLQCGVKGQLAFTCKLRL